MVMKLLYMSLELELEFLSR